MAFFACSLVTATFFYFFNRFGTLAVMVNGSVQLHGRHTLALCGRLPGRIRSLDKFSLLVHLTELELFGKR